MRGVVNAGTRLSVEEVRGKCISVTINQFGEKVSGWIDTKLVAAIPREGASELATRGAACLEKGEYDDAIAACTRAIEIDPKCMDAYTNRGWGLYAQGKVDKARSDFADAVRIDVACYRSRLGRIAVYLANDQFDQAMEELKKLGKELAERGQEEKGVACLDIADYTRQIAANSKDARAYLNRSEAWRIVECILLAEADYRAATKLSPAVIEESPRRQRPGVRPQRATKLSPAVIGESPARFASGGWAWVSMGEYDKAVGDFTKAIEMDPKNSSVFVGRAKAWEYKLEYDKAIADCNRAIEIDGSNARAFVGRGTAWVQKGESDKAIADFNAAIKIDPKFSHAFGNRARAWLMKGEYDKADADCSKAIELAPNEDSPFYDRGTVYLRKGEYDKAITDFTRAIELNPRWACTYEQLARAWLGQGDVGEAMAVTDKLRAALPDALQTHLIYGHILCLANRDEQAIAAFDKALQHDPNSVHALTARAVVRTKKGELDKAIRDANRAVDLLPRYWVLYVNRSFTWNVKGEYHRAIIDCSLALKLGPPDAVAYNNRATAWASLGRTEEAVADYDQAIRLAPRAGGLYANRGHIRFARQEYGQAMADYEQALRLWPNLVDALLGRAAVKFARDDWDGAIAEYDRVGYRSYDLAVLGRAAAKRAKGDFDEALADFGKLVGAAPRNARSYYGRADILILMGRHKEAVANYREAMSRGLPW